MLSELNIQNIAVIESADISFEPGFNVLSGETGAGKSIIVDALSAVLGERTSRELIRTGADSARVSAVFTGLPSEVDDLLKDMDLEPTDGGELLVTRTIFAEGRNQCRIGGTPATVAMLKRLGQSLISIHGQHDSQDLLNPEVHYRYLDAMGDYGPLIDTYREHYEEFTGLYRRYKQLSTDEDALLRRIDFLKFEIGEIEAANIRVGEYDELMDRRTFFRNSEKIVKGINNAIAALSDGDDQSGAVSLAFDALSDLKVPAQHMEEARDIETQLTDAAYALQGVRDALHEALYSCAYDPSEQDEVEERIAELNKLRSRFGNTEEEILQRLAEEKAELQSIEVSDADRKKLEEVLEQ
ncbi:MAG: AAA family ATPase, partial [Clostridiales bacterium]|nr:AAA family ATPase [Clostridiales bacterium]